MPIFSDFARHAYRAGLREAQDVLAECANVDFVNLNVASTYALKSWLLPRLYYHDPFRLIAKLNPGLKTERLEKDYDLFIAVLPYWRDISYLNAIENWRERSGTAICWIDELWTREIDELKNWLYVLDRFDYIFTGINGTHRVLSEALGRSCYELPGAADTLRFSPIPSFPERVIDVYSIGRRQRPVHNALLTLATNKDFFYVHDTVHSGDSPVFDYREHRCMYANMAKRSQLFTVAPGKMDLPWKTGNQVDIGFRCFEGIAAGSVLIGSAPDCELFRELFNWPDSVVPICNDGSDAASVVSDLLADQARLHKLSTRNSIESLLRHDWIYRWRKLFEVVGVDCPEGFNRREKVLRTHAQQLLDGASEEQLRRSPG